MSTKSITTTHEHDVCDVCARTLLRGEHPEIFINGGRRYSVCELCKPRALHEGWMREGALAEYGDSGSAPDRRRSLLGRRRTGKSRQSPAGARAGRDSARPEPESEPQTLDDELSLGNWPRHAPPVAPPVASPDPQRGSGRAREPRHVHAIPTSGEHKIAAAVDAFNRTQHRRTVASVSRSLGVPSVNVTPDAEHQSLVWIVVAWELCWYRYEVHLADLPDGVQVNGQGYELDELDEYERIANAGADQTGALAFI